MVEVAMNTPPKFVLAIESAIAGGSISLLNDGSEVASWVGTSTVSKAEDILANIDTLLKSNRISLDEIGLIAVSAGPGSFTGIRIGIATALGLKAGLSVSLSSDSALKAMAFSGPDARDITAAVPVGRNAVCIQTFDKAGGEVTAGGEPRTISVEMFTSLVRKQKDANFVLYNCLYKEIEPNENVVDFGSNIAYFVGQLCRINPGIVTAPLFIPKSF